MYNCTLKKSWENLKLQNIFAMNEKYFAKSCNRTSFDEEEFKSQIKYILKYLENEISS